MLLYLITCKLLYYVNFKQVIFFPIICDDTCRLKTRLLIHLLQFSIFINLWHMHTGLIFLHWVLGHQQKYTFNRAGKVYTFHIGEKYILFTWLEKYILFTWLEKYILFTGPGKYILFTGPEKYILFTWLEKYILFTWPEKYTFLQGQKSIYFSHG